MWPGEQWDRAMLAGLRRRWERFWMGIAGLSRMGRFATRLASAFAPPYMARFYLARLTKKPYVDPEAVIHHDGLELGSQSFIADRVIVYKAADGGSVIIEDCAHVLRDCVLETGKGGSIAIGRDTFLHPRCQVMAYVVDQHRWATNSGERGRGVRTESQRESAISSSTYFAGDLDCARSNFDTPLAAAPSAGPFCHGFGLQAVPASASVARRPTSSARPRVCPLPGSERGIPAA